MTTTSSANFAKQYHAMIDSIITVRTFNCRRYFRADGCEAFEISTTDADYICVTEVG